jgi:hypothetical protein
VKGWFGVKQKTLEMYVGVEIRVIIMEGGLEAKLEVS